MPLLYQLVTMLLLISVGAVCRPYHTLLLLEDERSLLSSLPIDASPSLIRLVKVANPLKNLHSLSLDADLAVEQVIDAQIGSNNVFINDLWPVRPNRQLSLYADTHERKIQGYAHTQLK